MTARIGINGRFLSVRQTGVQRAASNLLKSIFEQDQSIRYVIFTPKIEEGHPFLKYPHIEWAFSESLSSTLGSFYWEQVSLPRLVRQYNIDFLYCPANMGPIFYKKPLIYHLFDVSVFLYPTLFSRPFRLWYSFAQPYLAKKANHVITISDSAKKDIATHFSIDPKKITVATLAVDDFFKILTQEEQSIQKEDMILAVGSMDPRKNFKTLIQAFCSLVEQNPSFQTKLEIIGGGNHIFEKEQIVIKESLKERILFRGFLSDQDLKKAYLRAKIFAYPSLYEGFGLPVLEAMTLGTPVLASSSSSLPEVVEDCGLLLDPLNVEAWVHGMKRLLTSPSEAALFIQKGRKRAQLFTWDVSAKKMIHIFLNKNI